MVALVSTLLASGRLSAQESAPEDFNVQVHGFGTLGAVYHDRAGVHFRRNDSQPEGADGRQLDFGPDSVLGLQLDAHVTDRMSGAIQLVSRQNWEGNYRPQVTWAYLKFLPADFAAVRLGRLGIDAFLRGDSLDIDFGNLMIRPQFVFHPQSFDGGDVELVSTLSDEGIMRVKAYGGFLYDRRVNIDGGVYSFAGSQVLGLGGELEKDGWTGRVSLGRIKFNRLDDGLKPGSDFLAAMDALPNGADIVDRLSVQDRHLRYGIATFAYDRGAWQGMASYGRIRSDGWPTRQVFFANIGYRVDGFTPYLGYTWQHTPREIISSGFPAGLSPLTDSLSQVSAIAQSGILFNQQNFAGGLRYDFAPNRALKLQLDHIRYKDPDGVLDPALVALTSTAENRDYRSLTMLSVALNFVF